MADSCYPVKKPTEITQLVKKQHYTNSMPVSLVVETAFHIPTKQVDAKPPFRIFYMEDKDIYFLFYKRDAGKNSPVFYIIDGQTKEIKAIYSYMLDLCPLYTAGDVAIDCCVHYTEYEDLVFSVMILNVEKRTSYVVRFRLDFPLIKAGAMSGGSNQLGVEHIEFSADIIPRGEQDHIMSVPYTDYTIEYDPRTVNPLSTAANQRITFPIPDIEKLLPDLHSMFFHGRLNARYCGLTVTENGKYIFLLGSRMDSIYLTPFLPYPIDVQWMLVMDVGGMNGEWICTGPLYDTLDYNEETDGQSYITCPNIFDGKYFTPIEERKHRSLAMNYAWLGPYIPANPTTGGHMEYPDPTGDWAGGFIGENYFPDRPADVTRYASLSLVWRTRGHGAAWDNKVTKEPVFREAFWCAIDINRIHYAKKGHDLTAHWIDVILNKQPESYDDGSFVNIPTFCANQFCYAMGQNVIHCVLTRLIFLDMPFANGGLPQDAIYVASLIPGVPVTKSYWVRNVAGSTEIHNINLIMPIPAATAPLNYTGPILPDGVTLTITNFPTTLMPMQEEEFQVTVTYNPPAGTPPLKYVSIPFETSYYVVHRLGPAIPPAVPTIRFPGGSVFTLVATQTIVSLPNSPPSLVVPPGMILRPTQPGVLDPEVLLPAGSTFVLPAGLTVEFKLPHGTVISPHITLSEIVRDVTFPAGTQIFPPPPTKSTLPAGTFMMPTVPLITFNAGVDIILPNGVTLAPGATDLPAGTRIVPVNPVVTLAAEMDIDLPTGVPIPLSGTTIIPPVPGTITPPGVRLPIGTEMTFPLQQGVTIPVDMPIPAGVTMNPTGTTSVTVPIDITFPDNTPIPGNTEVLPPVQYITLMGDSDITLEVGTDILVPAPGITLVP